MNMVGGRRRKRRDLEILKRLPVWSGHQNRSENLRDLVLQRFRMFFIADLFDLSSDELFYVMNENSV